MKATVQYYDIEADKGVTKDCFCFYYNTKEDEFEFYPIDRNVKIYKSVIIKNPHIHMNYNDSGLTININGWMAVKSGGYAKNVVVIKIENKE